MSTFNLSKWSVPIPGFLWKRTWNIYFRLVVFLAGCFGAFYKWKAMCWCCESAFIQCLNLQKTPFSLIRRLQRCCCYWYFYLQELESWFENLTVSCKFLKITLFSLFLNNFHVFCQYFKAFETFCIFFRIFETFILEGTDILFLWFFQDFWDSHPLSTSVKQCFPVIWTFKTFDLGAGFFQSDHENSKKSKKLKNDEKIGKYLWYSTKKWSKQACHKNLEAVEFVTFWKILGAALGRIFISPEDSCTEKLIFLVKSPSERGGR